MFLFIVTSLTCDIAPECLWVALIQIILILKSMLAHIVGICGVVRRFATLLVVLRPIFPFEETRIVGHVVQTWPNY